MFIPWIVHSFTGSARAYRSEDQGNGIQVSVCLKTRVTVTILSPIKTYAPAYVSAMHLNSDSREKGDGTSSLYQLTEYSEVLVYSGILVLP